MYEMLTGQPPFLDTSIMGLYEKIVAGHIDWSLVCVDGETRDLISHFLVTDETQRLGGGCSGALEVQQNR